MSKPLYYTRQFVTLHQANPGFNVSSNAGNPYLDVGGVATSTRQYSLTFGYGDPGQDPNSDSFDYPEWSIGFATFVRPASYGQTATFISERPNGGTFTNTYAIWGLVSVPDTFILPAKYLSPSASDYVTAALDDARSAIIDYIKANAAPGVVPPLANFADQLNSSFGLYNSLKTHFEAQFQLINAVLKGTIDVNTFQSLSDNASKALLVDLTVGNVSSVLAEVTKRAVADLLIAQNPSDNRVDANIGYNSTAGFSGPVVISHQVVGSPGSDALTEHGFNGDVVSGGLGNDVIYGLQGNGILVGGSGVDTIDYSGVSTPMNINLETNVATSQVGGFTDRLAGFENAAGGRGNDSIRGTVQNNVLRGYDGDDALWGLAGDDTFEGGIGGDTLDGGLGSDTAFYSYGVFDPIRFTYTGVVVSLLNPLVNTGQATGDTFISIENISGSDGGDTLTGDAGPNKLFGNLGNDVLNGGDGNDFLSGGPGLDRLAGGLGNDTYVVDNAGDIVDERGGNGLDTVSSSITFSLANTARVLGSVENLSLTGTAAINGIGNALANVLSGNAALNVFSAGAGNDRLYGLAGKDILIGGAGNDVFVFNTALSASTNIDRVDDFSNVAGNNDTMWLENAVFSRLTTTGVLNPAFFKVGAAAGDANDYIVYNKATGALYYDLNGNGAGGAVQFALLINKPALTNADFVVI